MDGVFDPQPEGVVSKGMPVLDENGFIPKRELRVGQARNLRGFDAEYAFFTPAILYLHGGFRDAPLADLCYMTGTDIPFYYRKFGKPVFAGLEAPSNGNPDWNYVLWAVHKEHWPLVSDWLVSITLSYGELGEVAGIGQQELVVTDPLAAERTLVYHGGLPATKVTAFGLNGSRFRAYFRAAPVGPPALVFDDPARDMQVFAQALHDGKNPVDARTLHRLKEERDAGQAGREPGR